MKTRLLSLTAIAVLAAPLAAQATSITYDFTANGGAGGPLANVTSSGSFTFDSSSIPAGGGLVTATGLLTGVSFTWNGLSYDQNLANTGALEFNSNGLLDGVNFGTSCTAFGSCSVDPNANGWIVDGFTPVGTFGFADFLYSVGDGKTYDGSVSLSPAVAVPEPDNLVLLVGGGLALLLGCRRKLAPL